MVKVAIGECHFLKNNFQFSKMASFEAQLKLISWLFGKVENSLENLSVIFQIWFLCLLLHLTLLTIQFYFFKYEKYFSQIEDRQFRVKGVADKLANMNLMFRSLEAISLLS